MEQNQPIKDLLNISRALQDEIRQLRNDMSQFKEGSIREVTKIKVLYERELDCAKRLIDELAGEKAKFEIEVNKYKASYQKAKENVDRALKVSKEHKNKLQKAESDLSEYRSRCDSVTTDLKRKTEDLGNLRPQCAELKKHLSALRKQLEDATLYRVDLEKWNTFNRSKSAEYEVDIKNLTNKVELYERRHTELEDKLKAQTVKSVKELAEKDAEIDWTKNELARINEPLGLMTDNKSKPGKSYLNDSLGDSTAKKSKKRKVDGVEVSQTGTSTLSVYNQSAVSSIGLETCDIL